MVTTQIRFVRLMEELDNLRDDISDLAGEINSVYDDCHYNEELVLWEDGKMTETADNLINQIESEIDKLDLEVEEIRKALDLTQNQMDTYMDSCVVNRWELYAHLKGAEIVSLVDIANGRA